MKQIQNQVKQFSKPDGSFQSSKTIAPIEDTRYSLFTINILEDLIQDILYYYGDNPALKSIKSITMIYQTVPRIDKTFLFITK